MAQEENIDPRNDEQYRDQLTPMQYEVTRNKATERAFTGKYWNTFDDGKYLCVCCGANYSPQIRNSILCADGQVFTPRSLRIKSRKKQTVRSVWFGQRLYVSLVGLTWDMCFQTDRIQPDSGTA